ncbi:antitermination protein [Thorsellia anophelis]|uniref:Antitermination protein n=1 Tax=Thorsellia anophelis DSM 18579 TaxID=1123402 RepID=A0A1I0DAY7_9GAMM|nr:antitermination protein [Thorsellia anophelis]SET28729.1 Antitermination protein [Thorsellia anophelis DSM 18579]
MNLESAVKYFSPKSLSITTESPCTADDRLTATDIMGALGMATAKSQFGMALFFAKVDLSQEAKEIAIAELTRYALTQAPKYLGKSVSGRQLGMVVKILAQAAYAEYVNSPDADKECPVCKGAKKINGIGCKHCKGTGLVKNRCQCHGSGKVIDQVRTNKTGVLTEKICSRCNGKGFFKIPSSVAYRAVSSIVTELTQSTWSRRFKPLLDHLVIKCEIEENFANSTIKKVTK